MLKHFWALAPLTRGKPGRLGERPIQKYQQICFSSVRYLCIVFFESPRRHPLEPIPPEVAEVALALHLYERPLAASLSGIPEELPGWEENPCHDLHSEAAKAHLGIANFQGLSKNGPSLPQVIRRPSNRDGNQEILPEDIILAHLATPPKEAT